MLIYPHINPIAISIGPVFGIGPLRVHWYGIMYLIGFVAAWLLARYRARKPGSTWTALDIDDLIFYCAMGVILGGRIGWCIFYGHDVIAENWLNVLHIWDGGMSFQRRHARRHRRRLAVRPHQEKALCGRARFRGSASRRGIDGGPVRQLHQRGAVGKADDAALGIPHGRPRRPGGRAASVAAL